jgi:4'-phosphopantetheinyl transferase
MDCPSLAALDAAAYVVYARPERVLATTPRDQLSALLDDAERERHARFVFAEDADIFLVAHALTRSLLGAVVGRAPETLQFQIAERGRPELAGSAADSGVRFNLSHTHGLVACAVARTCAVGVDVEQLSRKVELLGVAARVFSPLELRELHALAGDAQRDRFFQLWTLKEAYVKAIGKGLAGPLQAISFFPARPDPVPVRFEREAAALPEAWCFRRCRPDAEFALAVALRAGPHAAISFRELAPGELTAA